MKIRVIAALAVLGAALAASGAQAFEGKQSAELGLTYGTEAFKGLDGQYGITVGYGYQLSGNLQARADLTYYRTATDKSGMNVTGTRVPLDLGARYYYPLTSIDANLALFGQGALELSFDDWHPAADTPVKTRTTVGALVGAGAEYALDPNWSALVNLQYHIIEDSFLSAGIGMAYHF